MLPRHISGTKAPDTQLGKLSELKSSYHGASPVSRYLGRFRLATRRRQCANSRIR